jgi:hypothetical protein
MTSHCQHPFGFHPVKDLGEIIMILELQRAMRIVPTLDRRHESLRPYMLFKCQVWSKIVMKYLVACQDRYVGFLQ